MRLAMMLMWLVPAVAWAQASPSVAVFPLEVTRPANLTTKQRDDLQGSFRAVLRRSGVLLPDGARQSAALLELKRGDCDRHDECLAQLAKLAGTLYAVFAAVDLTAEGNLVAFGRVVRDDGKLVAEVGRDDQVKMPKGKDAFTSVAPIALTRLVEQLKLAQLPLAKAVEAPIVTAAVKETPKELPKEVVLAPPPPPPALPPPDLGLGQRGAGTALLVGGGALAVAGGVLSAVGYGVGASAPNMGGATTADGARAAATGRTLNMVGLVVLGTGGAAALVGGLVLATAPTAPVASLSVVPVQGGGVVQMGGTF